MKAEGVSEPEVAGALASSGTEPQVELADDYESQQISEGMLQDLKDYQDEVERLLKQHTTQTTELDQLRLGMQEELHGLKEESWRLEMYAELEAMKRELAASIGIDVFGPDTAVTEESCSTSRAREKQSTHTAPTANALEVSSTPSETNLGALGADMELDLLNAELDAMQEQLKAAREDAAIFQARKSELEQELCTMLERDASLDEAVCHVEVH